MIVNTRGIPFRYMFNKVKREVAIVTVIGLIFNVFTYFLNDRLPDMPLGVPAFLGTAISVLLSFKMSQSYERWWEARKIWGAIVNDSRSLVVQLQSYLGAGYQTAIREIGHRQIAWCYALGDALRGLNPLTRDTGCLRPEEMAALVHRNNKPLAIMQQQALAVKGLADQEALNVFCRVQLDQTIVRLIDSMGKAERINSTVFPVTYRLFLHGAIYLFLITLSIALQDVRPIFEIPLLVLISALFFLVEKTAYNLQDPFRNRPSDTPVTAIARTIEINIRELLGEQDIPEPLKPKAFFLL
ncbi:bestrophin family protein [Parapedobacter koreensis]|uniref:Putative membrane protein n=1 Tax=Parapedobacter koreensis TaxID=332977 RepID=A0A1H7LN42_9SPHI|nr:bestrophin family ion channel [Parapedobacter koreensis]SEL00330.1 putative membrane protein [Parapedobacter koreensis]